MPNVWKTRTFAKCCKKNVKSNQQSVNDESDNEVYIFSIKHKSTDKRYPINIGYLDPVPILKQSNTKIFTYHSNTSLEVLGIFKAYTTAFDKALICRFYVVKGHEGSLLGKRICRTV